MAIKELEENGSPYTWGTDFANW